MILQFEHKTQQRKIVKGGQLIVKLLENSAGGGAIDCKTLSLPHSSKSGDNQ